MEPFHQIANQIRPGVIQGRAERRIQMNLVGNRHIVAILLLAVLPGCTQQQQSPREIREKTAEATAEAKSDAKAVADGLREGWNRNQSLDLNTASREQ